MKNHFNRVALIALLAAPWAVGAQGDCEVTIPYFESFESCTSNYSIPSCWTRPQQNYWGSSTIYPGSYALSSFATHGSVGMCFNTNSNSGSGGPNLLVSPAIPLEPDKIVVTFHVQLSSTSSGFSAGVITDPADPTTYIPLWQATNGSGWEEVEMFTSGIEVDVETVHIAFRLLTGSSVYLDEITIDQATSCHRPNGLAVSDVTTDEATFSWLAADEVNTYLVSLADSEEEVEVSDATNYTFSGLNSSSLYTARVRCICSDGDTTAFSTLDFRTACGNIVAPWSDNFESYLAGTSATFPDCWYRVASNNSYPYVMNTSNSHSGNNCIYFYTSSSNPNMVATSQIDDPSASRVNFWAAVGNSATFEAGYLTDPTLASTFVPLVTITGVQNGNTMREYEFYLDNIEADGSVYVAFRSTGSGASAYLDDVSVSVAEDCRKVSNLTIDDVTSTGGTISWGERDNADYYLITVGDDEPIESSDATYTFNDLENSRAYAISVQAYCSGDTSRPVSITLRTISEPYTNLPYMSGFENSDDAGWDFYANAANTNSWYIGSATNNGGSNALYISNDNGQTNNYATGSATVSYAARTIVVDEDGQYLVGFDWKCNGESNYDYLRAFLVPVTEQLTGGSLPGNVSSTSSFTSTVPTGWIDLANGKMNLTTNWTSHEKTISVTAGTYNLVLLWANDASSGTAPSAAVDNVYFGKLTCPSPTNLTATEVTSESITLQWTAGGEEEAWAIYVNNDDPIEVSDNHYTITGLTSGTLNTIKVAAVCDEYSRPILITLRTLTEPVTEFPYQTGFEVGEDAGWDFYNSTNGWYIGSAVGNGSTNSLYISNTNGSSNNYSNSDVSFSYAVRTLQFSEAGEYLVSFDWKANGESTYDYLRAWVAPGNATFTAGSLPSGSTTASTYTSTTPSGWTDLADGKLNLSSSWQTAEGPFSVAAAGVYQLVFMWANDGSGGSNPPAAIDNITIEALSCPAPVDLNFGLVTTSQIEVSWTPTGSESLWAVSLNDGTETTVATTSYTFTGLNPATSYTVKVRAICGEGDTSRAVRLSGYTTCDIVTHSDLPYTDNFDSYTSSSDQFNPCWSRLNYYTNSSPVSPYPYSSYTHGGSGNALYYYCSVGQDVYGILPEFEGVADLMVSMWLYSYNESQVRVTVGVMTNRTDTATFEPIQTLTLSASSTWEEFEVLLSAYEGTDGFIAFRVWSASGSAALYMDDLYVGIAPSCNKPVSVSATNPTENGCTVSINDPTEVGNYRLMVSNEGGYQQTVDVEGDTYVFSNLSGSTAYTITASSICDDGTITASVSTTFRTLCGLISHDELPWSENFDSYENGSSHPATELDCWSALNLYTGSWAYPYIVGFNHTGVGSSIIFNDGSYNTTHPILALPAFEDAISNLQLTFWVNSLTSSQVLQVGYMTDPSDASTFVPTDTVPSSSNWTQHTFTFPDEAVGNIALRYASGSNTFYVDEFEVSVVDPNIEPEPHQYYTVSVSSANTAYGTVSCTATGSVAAGTQATATATPNSGYRFTNWTNASGTVVSTSASYTFVVNSNVSLTANFEQALGINDASQSSISLYPNPTTSQVTLAGIDGKGRVSVLDMSGREVMNLEADGETLIDVSRLARGTYFVRISTATLSAVRKLVVE